MTELSHQWLSDLSDLRANEIACVLVTVITSKGSTPREAGTKMIVTVEKQFGTIGGGQVEFEAIELAKKLIADNQTTPEIKDFALGPEINQCCGGAVSVLLEPFLGTKKTLALFGAGHVGKEIIQVLKHLPINIKWIDEREHEFPNEIADNIKKIIADKPAQELKNLPDNCYILVITHLHSLDYELVSTALAENKFSYLGLIGSKTKKAKFTKNMRKNGISDERINDMTCPIGIDGIKGKHPREIAIAVAAELLKLGIAETI